MVEEVERFKSVVYSPLVDPPKYVEKHCFSSVHSSNILCVTFWNDNDLFLFSSDVTNRLVCINTCDGSVVCESKLSAPCCSLAVVKDGSLLLAGCMDGLLHVFSIETANYVITALTKKSQHKLHTKAILKLRTCDSLGLVASTSYDNTVSLFALNADGTVKEKSRFYFKYTCDGIAFCPKHNAFIVSERNQPFMNYIDLDTQEKREVSINNHEWDSHVSFCITDLLPLHDEDYLLALTDKGNVVVYSYGRNAHVMVVYSGSMLSDSYYNGVLVADREEKCVFTICPDNTIRVYSLYTGKEVSVLKGHSKTIRNMSCCGNEIATCSYDHSIRVWSKCV